MNRIDRAPVNRIGRSRAARFAPLCLIAFLSLTGLSLPARAADQSQMVELGSIAAVVNNDVITDYDLAQRLQTVRADLRSRNTPLPDDDVLRKQVLEHMVMERIELQEAQQEGVAVDDTQVDNAVADIMQSNNLTSATFAKALASRGETLAQFRDDVRMQLVITKLRDRILAGRVHVTDAEINSLLQQMASQSQMRDEFLIDHILIRLPANATATQIIERRARAEEALAQLKQGKPFAEVAASYSDAPDALSGGSLGWHAAAQLPQLFDDALANMKPGDTSDILRSPGGFHILRLENVRSSAKADIQIQTHVRHILIKTNDLMSDAEAKQKLEQIRARIVAGADFAQMARQYSDDSSASSGGDLGWVAPGDTVPEFEQAMDQLKPGEISQPVQTQFGWHLIQVIARRQEDVTAQNKRDQARREILTRKADEIWNSWLREARDTAFVQIRSGS